MDADKNICVHLRLSAVPNKHLYSLALLASLAVQFFCI
ncbi:hypothetical protein PLANPX_4887 [Lacipirellula parvula]|uniref:Uncharacterized protein n=1 Tax=Lacipirellula parvula TaxID=2650471 RepID=A0A5K7XFV4_9BACT|nr:hypothetical protein PLANPX_4887 [Lacipirellula parvula]